MRPARGDRVIIRVKDTGCGIPPEEIERIFEPFYSHRMHGPPGSGIGLSSSLRMIRAMGGDIRVESQVGVGTSFIVALPWGLESDTGTSVWRSRQMSCSKE